MRYDIYNSTGLHYSTATKADKKDAIRYIKNNAKKNGKRVGNVHVRYCYPFACIGNYDEVVCIVSIETDKVIVADHFMMEYETTLGYGYNVHTHYVGA